MALHQDTLRDQYQALRTEFVAAFPEVTPPHTDWWQLWLQKYPFSDIRDAIPQLVGHPLKSRFTQESTGKAISSLLREAAVRKAFVNVPIPRPQAAPLPANTAPAPSPAPRAWRASPLLTGAPKTGGVK